MAITYAPGISLTEDRTLLPSDESSLALSNIEFANRGVDRAMVNEQAKWLLDAAEPHKNPHRTWLAILALLYAGDLDSADAQCKRLRDDPAWADSAPRQELLTLLQARSSLLAGKACRAADMLQTMLDRGTSTQSACLAVAWLIEALVHLGELDRAHRILLDSKLAGPLDPDLPDRAHILAARGALHMAGGQFRHAIDDYMACGWVLDTSFVVNPAVIPWRSRAVFAALGARRYDLALALAEEELIAARKWGSPRGIGIALHAVGVARRDDTSVAVLEEAVALLAQGHACTDLMQALYDLGTMQIRRQDVAEGRRRLDEAAMVAHECRNAFWQERIRFALERLQAPANTSKLTRQEEKIAYLARAGHSNRHIAQMIFLTVRTVEFHLSSVYRKLSISGRRELVSALSSVPS
ncbi:LuxR C-terminal-related transcriptional regulator [Streptomyces sp. NBC_00984]|uniref:helix-turn-helix transcriptional regulator n=1 Tax=Streptomyces sp. NBC_00984 TaxID=2903700 RepID=UPI003863770F|nr:LuxR C-terminal-related transcriptional regulator [Streptomyces sp. NBC_00984]